MTIIAREGDFENDTVTIPLDEYMALRDEVKFLYCLKRCGVETWEGFQQALEYWRVTD